MQTKTFLALFCTIVIVFIGGNDGAPTTPKSKTTVTVKTQAPVVVPVTPPKVLAGSRTNWSTKLNPKSKKLFKDYSKIISKKLHTTHKVDLKYKLKPTKTATQIVSGILYHYLVPLATKKYAYVTILDRSWKKDQYGKEEHVTVRPQLYALNDKDI